jgi:spoIIIJ-associated protein
LKTIEITGRTVEEAISNALTELKLDREKVDIEVLEQGSRGIFKLLGAKPAKVKATVKRDFLYEAKSFLRDILNKMDLKCEIRMKEEDGSIKINLDGPNVGILIGHRGETLDALQYLVSLIINKDHNEDYKRVILDTENYRLKREETLKRLASRLAYKVKSTGKYVKLEPMNPYERRIIHSALQNNEDITTYSEGEEPFRRVVIDLKKA